MLNVLVNSNGYVHINQFIYYIYLDRVIHINVVLQFCSSSSCQEYSLNLNYPS